jgi:hypothetical protein
MFRCLLRALVIAGIGVAFTALSILVYWAPIFADLHSGSAVLMTATRSGVTWSHTYDLESHPVYFGVKVLTDLSGATGFGGFGLLLLYGAARGAIDPSGARVSARAKHIAAAWVYTCAGAMVVHFALILFPYLLKNDILS